MTEEVQIGLPLPLALIVVDLINLFGFIGMEHASTDPKYYELQGKSEVYGILWYIDLKEGNSNLLWCFHERWFFATEDEDAACLEIGLGMSGNDFPFEITLTLFEAPKGDDSIKQTDTITIVSAQHWNWLMDEYVQSYIDDASEISRCLLQVLQGHWTDSESEVVNNDTGINIIEGRPLRVLHGTDSESESVYGDMDINIIEEFWDDDAAGIMESDDAIDGDAQ